MASVVRPEPLGLGHPVQLLQMRGQRVTLRGRENIADISNELYHALGSLICHLQVHRARRL